MSLTTWCRLMLNIGITPFTYSIRTVDTMANILGTRSCSNLCGPCPYGSCMVRLVICSVLRAIHFWSYFRPALVALAFRLVSACSCCYLVWVLSIRPETLIALEPEGKDTTFYRL